MPQALRITTRNARFQQWHALLGNRTKRQRAGEFLVQGVRPVSLAVRHGWPLRAVLYDADRPLSGWARSMVTAAPEATRAAVAAELMRELGEKEDGAPEIIAVAALPEDRLARLGGTTDAAGPPPFVVVFDRPTNPGNIGTLIRSADAFGATGVVVTGHAADPYDPRSVRATAGSLFALPVVRAPSHLEVLDWVGSRPAAARPRVVATDEAGELDVADADLTGPLLVLVGNETRGLASAWREACDVTVRIPMSGSASSLNAASAATVVLYEADRQRSGRSRRPGSPGVGG